MIKERAIPFSHFEYYTLVFFLFATLSSFRLPNETELKSARPTSDPIERARVLGGRNSGLGSGLER